MFSISSRYRRPRRDRGIALLSVIALLLVFVIFAGAVVVQMSQEVNSVHNDGVSNRALVAADAGVRGMMVAIEESLSKAGPLPGPQNYTYPEAVGSPTVSYASQIIGQWDSLPGGYQRFYLISSTGTVVDGNQNHNRTVNVLIQAQSVTTFGSASNYDTNQFGHPVWYTPNQRFNGPVYDGGPMHVEYDDTLTTPIFGSTVQTPNKPSWYDLNGGGTGNPASWTSIISGGSPNFEVGGNGIGLPDPSKNMVVASEAFYGNDTNLSGFGSCGSKNFGGVCMNSGTAELGGGTLTTGIFINQGNKGAAPTISSSSAGSTDTLTITGSFGTYNIAIDFGTDTTSVCHVPCGGKPTTYIGTPSGDAGSGSGNGAIFVDGNANIALGSEFQGQYVIAVPDFSAVNNNINIIGSGDITYNDPTKDLLGIWANNVIMNTTASNVNIYASIIAGYPGEAATAGGFYNRYCNANTCTAGNQGNLTLTGSLMENMRGALGKFFSLSTWVGYNRVINYDPRLGSHPPPFYPVTGNYTIIAWDDQGQ